jgi:hypothetical protein
VDLFFFNPLHGLCFFMMDISCHWVVDFNFQID